LQVHPGVRALGPDQGRTGRTRQAPGKGQRPQEKARWPVTIGALRRPLPVRFQIPVACPDLDDPPRSKSSWLRVRTANESVNCKLQSANRAAARKAVLICILRFAVFTYQFAIGGKNQWPRQAVDASETDCQRGRPMRPGNVRGCLNWQILRPSCT